MQTCDALQKYDGQEPNETVSFVHWYDLLYDAHAPFQGYSLAHAPSSTVWEHYAKNPHLSKRFANSMKSFFSNEGQSPVHLATGYPWSNIPAHGTVIDLGGSEGHVSATIAQRHQYLNFVVQDLPSVIETAALPDEVDEDVRKRVSFEAHDFLTDQRRQGEVFLLRWILHDWPDLYVVRILRHLRPALRPGNKVLVNDQLMPEPGSVPTVIERQIRLVSLLR